MLNDLILAHRDVLILLARVLLMALFLTTGWKKLNNFSATATYMAATGSPVPKLSAIAAIIMECVIALALVVGVFTRPLALLYVVFTLLSALIGHRFWNATGAEHEAQKVNFLKNLSIMGGLLLLAVTGPGKYALVPG